MKTFCAVIFLCLLAGLSQAASLRQLIGLCAEMCPGGGCPAGYVCRSNGCGHQCYVATAIDCSLRAICALYCENGYALGADGCPTCACQSGGVVAVE